MLRRFDWSPLPLYTDWSVDRDAICEFCAESERLFEDPKAPEKAGPHRIPANARTKTLEVSYTA